MQNILLHQGDTAHFELESYDLSLTPDLKKKSPGHVFQNRIPKPRGALIEYSAILGEIMAFTATRKFFMGVMIMIW